MAAFVLACLAGAFTLTGALAHAVVVRSEPADNAVVSRAPAEMRLWFSEPLTPEFSKAEVLDARSQVVPGVQSHTNPDDPTLMIVTLPALPAGLYNIVYTSLSAADGHATQGHLVFTVAAAGTGGPVAIPPAQPAVAPLEAILRWLNFGLLAAVTGAVGVGVLLLRPIVPIDAAGQPIDAALARARRRAWGWGAWMAAAGVAFGGVYLYWQAAVTTLPSGLGAAGLASTISAAVRLAGETRTGTLWILRQVLLIVLAMLLFTLHGATDAHADNRLPRGARPVFGVLSFALLATQALSGHAAAVTPGTAISIIADTLHLAAAGFWVGGLLALAVALLPMTLARRSATAFTALAHAGWEPFGSLAAVSVGVLFATGLYNTGREVASLDALLTTFYGRTLLVKIVLVLALGTTGLLISSLLHPHLVASVARILRRPAGWTPLALVRLPWLAGIEVAFGLVVLLATGIITSSSPPHGPEFAPVPPPAAPVQIDRQIDDLSVSFLAQPNQPGQNVMSIRVESSQRPTPAPILRVIVHFTFLGYDMGTVSADAQEQSAGVYRLDGQQLSLAGPWQVDVAVRRKGLEDSVARFQWTVVAPAPVRSRIISDRPLEPVLTAIAGALLVVVLAMAGVIWQRRHAAKPVTGNTRMEGAPHG